MKRMIIITKLAWYEELEGKDTEYKEKLIKVQDEDQPLDEFLEDLTNQVMETAYQILEDEDDDAD